MAICERGLKRSSIVCFVAFLSFWVGIVLMIVAVATAPSIESVVAGQKEFSLDLSDPSHCGYNLYIAADANCDAAFSALQMTDPLGIAVPSVGSGIGDVCSPSTSLHAWEVTHEPKLQRVARVGHADSSGINILGAYRVHSEAAPVWAIDFCEEGSTEVKALAATLRHFSLSLAFAFCGITLFCVTCCCLRPRQDLTQVIVMDKDENPELL